MPLVYKTANAKILFNTYCIYGIRLDLCLLTSLLLSHQWQLVNGSQSLIALFQIYRRKQLLYSSNCDFNNLFQFNSRLGPLLVSLHFMCGQELSTLVIITLATVCKKWGYSVYVCVSECVPSFSVLAAATFSPHTQETPGLLSCCKKLSPLNKHLLSSWKQQKPLVCLKACFKILHLDSPSAKAFKGIKW